VVPPTSPCLPALTVPPEAYDEAYYRSACWGQVEWERSGGREMAAIYPGALQAAQAQSGEVLVDIGAGRGELLVAAAQDGLEAIGVEYSEAAVALAELTLEQHGRPAGARMIRADSRAIPLPDCTADLVKMLDVIEHLNVPEQLATLREARRILRPGGRVLIHTMPNRLVYDITYRLQRRLRPRRRSAWPRDPRVDYEHVMHVGEQTVFSLRRRLRAAGFVEVDVSHGEWVHTEFVPDDAARSIYHRLAAHRLTAPLGCGDLWGRARRSTRASRSGTALSSA